MKSETTVKNVLFLGLFALGIVLLVKEGCPVYINFARLFIAAVASIRFI